MQCIKFIINYWCNWLSKIWMQCIKFIINYWCNWLRFFTFKLKIVTNHTWDTKINVFCCFCQCFSSHIVCHDTHPCCCCSLTCCPTIRPSHPSTPLLPCQRWRICSSSSPAGRGQWRIVPWRRWRWCTCRRIETRDPSRCSWPFRTRCWCSQRGSPLEFPWSVLWMEVIIRWENLDELTSMTRTNTIYPYTFTKPVLRFKRLIATQLH